MFLFPLTLFIFGTLIGSFLGVLADRLPNGRTILGRSRCDFCKKELSVLDLMPILSFVFLRGRCRHCGEKLSLFYPTIELLTGFLFASVYFFLLQDLGFKIYDLRFFLDLIYYLIIVSALVVICFADLRYRIIPDSILLFILIFTLPYLIFSNENILVHVFSGLISGGFFLLLYIATKGRGMGFGDVKFAAVLGLIFGIPGTVLAIYLSFLTGSVASIILILWGRKRFGDKISFGPFMVLGGLLTIFFKEKLISLLLPFFT